MEIGSLGLGTPPVASTTVAVPPEIRAERRQLIQAVHAVNAVRLLGENRELSFALDRETKRPVVRVIDSKTDEVIRQIPADYVLWLAQQLDHEGVGTGSPVQQGS